MKYRLKELGQVPYGGGFEINRPDLGMVGSGTVFDMLDRNVRQYRRANGIPTGLGFSEELECAVCEKYPVECEPTDSNLPLKRRLTLDDVVRGTKVLLALKLSGSQLVPKEEAERRGAICARCPLAMQFPKPCNGLCAELKTVVDAIVGGYTTSMDNDYRSCAICSCYIGSQIRLPYAVLEKGLTHQMKLEFQTASQSFGCWKVPGAM
jgi:hypothetical protein